MSRSFKRAAGLLGVTMVTALLASGTTLARTVPAAGTASSLAAAILDRYCYNWDFLNNTGQDANDLHIRLKGIKAIGTVYTGPLNPFGAPNPSSGYDAGTDTYVLNFSNGSTLSGEMAHIGLCTDQPLLALAPDTGLPSFTWTLNGQALPVRPRFAGLAWNWRSRRQLQIQLWGDPQVPMTLLSLNLLDAGDQLELDDLNDTVAAQLPMVGELAPDPLALAPGASRSFDVFFDRLVSNAMLQPLAEQAGAAALLEANHPYVLEAVLEVADDPGNTIHLYSQALSPLEAVYLPILRKG